MLLNFQALRLPTTTNRENSESLLQGDDELEVVAKTILLENMNFTVYQQEIRTQHGNYYARCTYYHSLILPFTISRAARTIRHNDAFLCYVLYRVSHSRGTVGSKMKITINNVKLYDVIEVTQR